MKVIKKFIPILENRWFDMYDSTSYRDDVTWYCIVSWDTVKTRITFTSIEYYDNIGCEKFNRTDIINIIANISETAKLFRLINSQEICNITHFKEYFPEEFKNLNFCFITNEEMLWECANYNNWFWPISEDIFLWQLLDKNI